jgi:5S rRNA maturation endonuclease (ribonuclease M5)
MAESVTTALADLWRRGSGHRNVRCPAHADARPSLSVRLTSEGKVLLKCHAGCTYDAVVAAAGLSRGEVSAGDRSELWTPRGEAVAIYQYTDDRGEPLFDVLRLSGKQFLQRRRDPAAASGYRWKLDDVRRVLYRLPKVLRAAAEGATVYVCEGEKDVQALEREGVVATCNPGGAGKWRAEYGEALRGAHVVVIADRDEPGYRHAETIREQLSGVATSLRVVEAAAGKDASDHLASGFGLDDFREVTEAAATAAASVAQEQGALPAAVRACDIEPGEPVTWLEYGTIPAREITLIVGDPGGGKTSVVLKVVAAKAAEGLDVLVVSGEDPPEVIRNRLEAIAVGHRWDVAVVLRHAHVLALTGLQLGDPKWQTHLFAEVERTGAILVVLDPLFELTGVDEDSNVAQRPILSFLRLLIVHTGTAVIVVHHFGKAGEGKRKIDRVRGASAWFGAARAVYAVEPRDDGVQVECLKLSRAVRPASYVLERTVVTDGENSGVWRSATFRQRSLQAADVDLAEQWILEQLATASSAPTTTELRRLAVGTGHSREDLAGGLRRLEASGRITFEQGTRGAKHWQLATLPDAVGKVVETTLPTLPGPCPAGSESPAGGCPAPFKGAGSLAGHAAPVASNQPAVRRREPGAHPELLGSGALVRLRPADGRVLVETLDGSVVLASAVGEIDDPTIRHQLLAATHPAARRTDLNRILDGLVQGGQVSQGLMESKPAGTRSSRSPNTPPTAGAAR